MKIYNPLLIKTGSQEQIQYWESPEPNRDDYHEPWSQHVSNEIKRWQKSVKTLDVHPSAVEEIWQYLKQLKGWDDLNVAALKLMKTSFTASLSGIEDRLEIKSNCCGRCTDYEECDKMQKYFILKPIPSKEEETPQFDKFKKLFDESFAKRTPKEFIQCMENLGYKFQDINPH